MNIQSSVLSATPALGNRAKLPGRERSVPTLAPTLADRLAFALVAPRTWLLKLLCARFEGFVWTFRHVPPAFLAWDSAIRARKAFHRARRKVPAYGRFVASRPPGSIPETDKASYIRAYPVADRCFTGRLPRREMVIDESSGSTGTPYDWVRSTSECRASHRMIGYFARHLFGPEPWITLNAFSLGAWATGLNMGQALQRVSVVKNTGPDIGKLLHTLAFFGPDRPYLLTGYPPFMKHLLDEAEARGFPLADYRLHALVGGEGMSEGLRDYLLRHFRTVYSGYGATDLEIGVAGETPLSVALRRLALANPAFRRRLFGEDPRLPMVFQYNPLMHHVDVNGEGELLVTLTRPGVLSPRLRYNVHDQGGTLRFDRMAELLEEQGLVLRDLCPGYAPLQLPFLWVFGRRDHTVSIMGANIYPEDLEACLYAEPDLARRTRAFCLQLAESGEHQVRPRFHFEVEGDVDDDLRRRFEAAIPARLVALNADFREAWREYPDAMRPEIRLHSVGEGPFAANEARIKQVRVLGTA